MARSEFPTKVRREALKRADGRCEGLLASGERCPCLLSFAKYAFDHVIADQLGGKPELSNCAVLCLPCHADKTRRDAALIAKAKRRSDHHVGVTAPRAKIRGASLPAGNPAKRASTPLIKPLPPRRSLYAPSPERIR